MLVKNGWSGFHSCGSRSGGPARFVQGLAPGRATASNTLARAPADGRRIMLRPVGSSPEEAAAILRRDIARWRDLVASAGIPQQD